MPAIKIQGFSGIVPRMGADLLQDGQAQTAYNVKLFSGELRPWRKPLNEATTLVANASTIFRLRNTATGASKWLSWANDVNAVPGPIADTSDFRVYYTGDTAPRKTNWTLATSGVGPWPTAYLEMGVPAPAAAPTLTPTGGTGTPETRAYVYTYVSTFGAITEESAPSPAAQTTLAPTGGSVLVNGFSAVPAGSYNITAINIYRTLTGSSTVSYQFVATIPIATTSYNDTLTSAQLGTTLGTLGWVPPPATLQGLTSMPNGMLAGFTGNQVWFCEPYSPHAWPVAYMKTVDYPIVGIAASATSLVVVTTKIPFMFTGTHPSAMSEERIDLQEPGVSKRSIAADEYGVIYASPNGLVAIGPGVRDVISRPLYSRDEWQALLPGSMFSTVYSNMYVGFSPSGTGANGMTGIIMSRGDSPPLSTIDFPAQAAAVDTATGYLYAVSKVDGKLYQLDADPANNSLFSWRSKRYTLTEPTGFTCLQLAADYAYMASVSQAVIDAIKAANTALFSSLASYGTVNTWMVNDSVTVNGSASQPLPSGYDLRNLTVTVRVDGLPVLVTAMTSLDPIRLPAVKGYIWEFDIAGNVPVRSLAVATSIAELKGV